MVSRTTVLLLDISVDVLGARLLHFLSATGNARLASVATPAALLFLL